MTTILIVDDEDSIRRLYRAELEGAGFEVRELPSAVGLLEAATQDPPDLVVLGAIELPGRGTILPPVHV